MVNIVMPSDGYETFNLSRSDKHVQSATQEKQDRLGLWGASRLDSRGSETRNLNFGTIGP